jgi:hypothetical protein
VVRGTWEEFGGWEYFEGTLRREFGRCIMKYGLLEFRRYSLTRIMKLWTYKSRKVKK